MYYCWVLKRKLDDICQQIKNPHKYISYALHMVNVCKKNNKTWVFKYLF